VRRVIRTPAAGQDYRDILEYLADHSEQAAERFAEEVADRIRLLSTQPRIGRPRDDLAPGVRSIVIGQYILFYRASDSEVVVLRILHGSRDIPRVFGDPDSGQRPSS
jgi:toxin ParE1/3/4